MLQINFTAKINTECQLSVSTAWRLDRDLNIFLRKLKLLVNPRADCSTPHPKSHIISQRAASLVTFYLISSINKSNQENTI